MTKGGWSTDKEKAQEEAMEAAKYDAANAKLQWEAVVEYPNGGSITQRVWHSEHFAQMAAREMRDKYLAVYGEPEWYGAQLLPYKAGR